MFPEPPPGSAPARKTNAKEEEILSRSPKVVPPVRLHLGISTLSSRPLVSIRGFLLHCWPRWRAPSFATPSH